jgi:PadR family transcriptional regulator, regulatory protein AphA
MPRRLTTTSYAILGLLAVRPWSAYELANQFSRSLRYAWPTSLTHAYSEPKRLVADKLAAAREEAAGPQRTRTVYSITAKGRKELARWLNSPAHPPEVHHEAMLRLAFADQGTKETLLATLAHQRDEVQRMYDDGLRMVESYLDNGGPFPQRLHLIAAGVEFHARLLELELEWLDEVRSEVETWDTTVDVGLTPMGRARLQDVLDRSRARTTGGTTDHGSGSQG